MGIATAGATALPLRAEVRRRVRRSRLCIRSAGTAPEIILPIEARKIGDRWAWHTAGARFSDHRLYLRHQDKDVWTFLNDKRDPFFRAGENDTYRLFRDRVFEISTLSSETRTNAKSER